LIQLRQRFRETKKLQKALEATVARNNAVLSAIKSLTAPAVDGHSQAGPFAFLSNTYAAEQLGVGNATNGGAEAGPLETNVSFALSQLPALRELVAELRPQLGELSGMTDQPVADGAVARSRREYVESQSRRAVERQGLGVDNGALDTLGKVVTADELAALEAMADDMRGR
jgi:kinetochore protein Mis12/MTW1